MDKNHFISKSFNVIPGTTSVIRSGDTKYLNLQLTKIGSSSLFEISCFIEIFFLLNVVGHKGNDEDFTRVNKLVAKCLLAISLAGCVSKTMQDEYGRVIIHHFGYVKIIKPPVFPDNKTINVTGTRLLGFSVGDGFTIGYKSSEYIHVPIDCRVLVVVKDSAQLDHMIEELSIINEEKICATVSPK